jgi:hypothetical protein
LKPNRSSKFTTGLVNTFEGNDLKVFFFELDADNRDQFETLVNLYNENELDFIVHRTGGGGFHYLSPTMISKEGWKRLHNQVKDINPRCPMTTLRMQPNKHVGEELIWYNSSIVSWNAENKNNNWEMCQYLNKYFGSKFKGTGEGGIKIVRYPLPLEVQP